MTTSVQDGSSASARTTAEPTCPVPPMIRTRNAISVRSQRLQRALKVDADARFNNSGILGHAMHPLLLAPASHHDQIAGGRFECDRFAAAAWLHKKTTCCAQSNHGDDTVRSSTGKPVSMPARAVVSVTVI